MLISCGDSDMRRWDALTGAAVGGPMSGHTVELWALTTWRVPDGRPALAFAGDDLTVRRWDAVSGAPVGEPMTGHTGPVVDTVLLSQPPVPGPAVGAAAGEGEVARPQTGPELNGGGRASGSAGSGRHIPALAPAVSEPPAQPAIPASLPLEASPEVSALIYERLAAQPGLTMREAKRLVNVWQLYARLLDLTDPPADPQMAVARGCHLVILAEIITRWPALQRSLSGSGDTGCGLAAFAAASGDDEAWMTARQERGLDGKEHDKATRQLRELLRDYQGAEVASLAARLL